MHGTLLRRALGFVMLAGLVAMLVSDTPAFGQKNNRTGDPTKPAITKMTCAQLSQHIDQVILTGIKAEKFDASPRCSDEDFLRRVYLDLAGKIPTAEQAVSFLDSKESNKRAKLIDQLLASKEFGQHQADIWAKLLLPTDSDNRRLVQFYPNLKKWFEDQFNGAAQWDKMVKEFMTTTGDVSTTSPAIYWVANRTADKMTDNVTRMFLGIQLQCAQCHNHPFTDYKQNEYWETAAFFLRVGTQGNPKAAAKNGGAIKVGETAKVPNKRMLPESAKFLTPKFLRGEKPTVKASEPLRPIFANWMVSPKNPFFARAMVNRTWGLLFGRGFVNPIDDIHDANPNSHPDLLDSLEKQFIANDFDVKFLFRVICNSETYQRSSRPHGNNAEAGAELFARMAIKPLTGEQLFDSLAMVVGRPATGPGARKGGMAGRGPQNQRDAFAAFFGAEDGADATEYQAGIPQVLRLMNSPAHNTSPAAINTMTKGKTQSEVVEKMYLMVLARRPSAEDLDRVNAYLKKHKEDARQGYAGLLWALMNSSEFALNR